MSESAKKKLSGGVAGAGRGRAPGGKNRQTAVKTGVVSAKGKASQRDPGNGMKSASGKHGSRKTPEKAEAKKPGASAAGKASIPGRKKATTCRPAGATAKKATAVKKTIAAGAKASAGKTVSEKRSKATGKRAASAKKATTAAKTAPAKQSKQGRAPSANYQKGAESGKNISIIETCKISATKYVQIIRVGERYVAIGVSKDQITNLGDVPSEDIILSEKPAENIGFKDILEKIKGEKKK